MHTIRLGRVIASYPDSYTCDVEDVISGTVMYKVSVVRFWGGGHECGIYCLPERNSTVLLLFVENTSDVFVLGAIQGAFNVGKNVTAELTLRKKNTYIHIKDDQIIIESSKEVKVLSPSVSIHSTNIKIDADSNPKPCARKGDATQTSCGLCGTLPGKIIEGSGNVSVGG